MQMRNLLQLLNNQFHHAALFLDLPTDNRRRRNNLKLGASLWNQLTG